MVNDAYIEDNKMKKQAWLMLPLALLITAVIVVFGNFDDDDLTPPKLLESSPQGMLLALADKSSYQPASAKPVHSPDYDAARQHSVQLLGQYAADFKQLRTQLEVWAAPGLDTRLTLARNIGEVLAHHNLGRLNQSATPPAAIANMNSAVVLICNEADSALARRMLGALTPFLHGTVRVHFDTDLAAQSMKLYLFGKPVFNAEGQATFDKVSF